MSLSAQDIIALARAGYNAEQISLISKESLSTEISTESTPSTEPTQSTPSTVEPELSTPSTNSAPQPNPIEPAKTAPEAAAKIPDQGPTMQDLMSKLAEMEKRFAGRAINQDQQPGQEDRLTGEKVLANILDPRQ